MNILLSLLGMTAILGVCLYHKGLVRALIALTGTMVALTLFGDVAVTGWLCYLLAVAIFAVPAIRQTLISQKALSVFEDAAASSSRAEKHWKPAPRWWNEELFPEQAWMEKIAKTHRWSKTVWSRTSVPRRPGKHSVKWSMITKNTLWGLQIYRQNCAQYLKDHKFFAMIIKKKYGGLEFSAYTLNLSFYKKLTGVSGVLSSTVVVPNSLGPGELLQHYGTEEQRNHYLPRLAEVEILVCLTSSPEAGSDAGSIPDYGVVCKGEWQGEKRRSSRHAPNLEQALHHSRTSCDRTCSLAFKLRDPDGLLGDQQDLGITCALIPTDLKGVEIGSRHFP